VEFAGAMSFGYYEVGLAKRMALLNVRMSSEERISRDLEDLALPVDRAMHSLGRRYVNRRHIAGDSW
jgi:hypothetical protein